jgi:hypothetical protein
VNDVAAPINGGRSPALKHPGHSLGPVGSRLPRHLMALDTGYGNQNEVNDMACIKSRRPVTGGALSYRNEGSD